MNTISQLLSSTAFLRCCITLRRCCWLTVRKGISPRPRTTLAAAWPANRQSAAAQLEDRIYLPHQTNQASPESILYIISKILHTHAASAFSCTTAWKRVKVVCGLRRL